MAYRSAIDLGRKIIRTADGSHTIRIEEWNEQYHSMHGAVAESYHVFIKSGLRQLSQPSISILEMGFGTGLNAIITLAEALKSDLRVRYSTVEAHPVPKEEWQQLNYPEILKSESLREFFQKIHQANWEQWVSLCPEFQLRKLQLDIREFDANDEFHLIYFDAFGYRVQPELWTEQLFEIMFRALKPGGILVTYAAKGLVRRTLQNVGFTVERLPGPPGKREMLRAVK